MRCRFPARPPRVALLLPCLPVVDSSQLLLAIPQAKNWPPFSKAIPGKPSGEAIIGLDAAPADKKTSKFFSSVASQPVSRRTHGNSTGSRTAKSASPSRSSTEQTASTRATASTTPTVRISGQKPAETATLAGLTPLSNFATLRALGPRWLVGRR